MASQKLEEFDAIITDQKDNLTRLLTSALEAERDEIGALAQKLRDIAYTLSPSRQNELNIFLQRLKQPETLSSQQSSSLIADIVGWSVIWGSAEGQELLLQLSRVYTSFQDRLQQAPTWQRQQLLEPKIIMFTDDNESFRVSPANALKALSRNQYGDIVKQNTRGNHPVISVNGVHFKADDPRCDLLSPAYEKASYLLQTLLLGQGIAPSTFVLLTNVPILTPTKSIALNQDVMVAQDQQLLGQYAEAHPEHKNFFTTELRSYVMQASQTVEGSSFEFYLQHQEDQDFMEIDFDSFVVQVICSLILSPRDAKPDNFIVTPEGKIVGIDNDLIFSDEIICVKTDRHYVGLKNCLFLLPLMDNPIPTHILQQLQSFSPEGILTSWLRGLQVYHCSLDRWKDAGVMNQRQFEDCVLKLRPNFVIQLLNNLQRLQTLTLGSGSSEMLLQDLLELWSTPLGKYYKTLRNRYPNPYVASDILFSRHEPSLEELLKYQDDLSIYTSSNNDYVDRRSEFFSSTIVVCMNSIDLSKLDDQPLRQGDLVESMGTIFAHDQHKILHPSWSDSRHLLLLVKQNRHPKAIQLARKFGWDPKYSDEKENTALHHAVLSARTNEQRAQVYITQLLELYDQTEFLNKSERTPLDLAMENKFHSVFIQLIEAGAGSEARSSLAFEYVQSVLAMYDSALKQRVLSCFRILEQRNQRVHWKMVLETIFPSTRYFGDSTTPIETVRTFTAERVLLPEIKRQLFDGDEFKRSNTSGKRPVARVEKGGYVAFLKQFPELPGIEQAVGTLTRQLAGFGAPYIELIRYKDHVYLISEGISGETLEQTIKLHPEVLQQLEPASISSMILAAMLINPEDGKPDNYIVEPLPQKPGEYQLYRIIGIDNDHAFVPSSSEKKLLQKKQDRVQVKTILFTLDEMSKPIHPKVRDQYARHDPAQVIMLLLKELCGVNGLLESFFSPDEIQYFYDHHGSFFAIPLPTNTIFEIYGKLVRMQTILEEQKDNPYFSHFDLLQLLDPLLGQRYHIGSSTKTQNALERFEHIDGGDYSRQRAGSFVSTRQAKQIMKSIEITQQQTIHDLIKTHKFDELSPNVSLQAFNAMLDRNKTIAQQSVFVTQGQGQDLKRLTDDQRWEVLDQCNFSVMPAATQQTFLRSIKGIEWHSLPLKNMSALTDTLLQENVAFTHLTKVDFTGCVSLTDTVVNTLLLKAVNLRKANLSQLRLQWIGQKAKVMLISTPSLTHLWLNLCTTLREIHLSAPKLELLEMQNCLQLVNIDVEAPNLHTLTLNGCVKIRDNTLDRVVSSAISLQTLNLIECVSLQNALRRSQNPWATHIFFVHIPNMDSKIVDLTNKQIQDDNMCTVASMLRTRPVTHLTLNGNNISHIGIQTLSHALQQSQLVFLDLSHNNIDNEGLLSLSNFLQQTRLTTLNCRNCRITHSGLEKLASVLPSSSVAVLDLAKNNIGDHGLAVAIKTMLSINQTLKLSKLDLSETNLTKDCAVFLAQFVQRSNLTELRLANNNLSVHGSQCLANVLKRAQLTLLDLSWNNIEVEGSRWLFDALPTSRITHLYLQGNGIGNVSVAALAANLSSTKLLVLDLSSNNIGDGGADALADVLQDSILNTLLMENNPIMYSNIRILDMLERKRIEFEAIKQDIKQDIKSSVAEAGFTSESGFTSVIVRTTIAVSKAKVYCGKLLDTDYNLYPSTTFSQPQDGLTLLGLNADSAKDFIIAQKDQFVDSFFPEIAQAIRDNEFPYQMHGASYNEVREKIQRDEANIEQIIRFYISQPSTWEQYIRLYQPKDIWQQHQRLGALAHAQGRIIVIWETTETVGQMAKVQPIYWFSNPNPDQPEQPLHWLLDGAGFTAMRTREQFVVERGQHELTAKVYFDRAEAYSKGYTVDFDEDKAVQCYQQAYAMNYPKAYQALLSMAHKGIAPAQYAIGADFKKQQQLFNAAVWFARAAVQGHVSSREQLLYLIKNRQFDVPNDQLNPLHIAAQAGDQDLISAWTCAGLDILARSSPEDGAADALEYGIKCGHRFVVEFLQPIKFKVTQDQRRKVLTRQQMVIDKVELVRRNSLKDEELERPLQEEISTAFDIALPSAAVADASLLERMKAEYLHKENAQKERNYINTIPHLQNFFKTLSQKLEELFLAYKVLSTGVVSRSGGWGNHLATAVVLLGSSVPVPGFSIATGVLGFLGHIAYNSYEKNKFTNVAANLSLNIIQMSEEVDEASRRVTFMFQSQIQQLKPPAVIQLAECAVRRLIEAFRANIIPNEANFATLLIKTLITFDSRLGKFPFSDFSLETIKPKKPKWTDRGIFQETGLVLEVPINDKKKVIKHYRHSKSNHAHYGFCLGDESLLRTLGFVELKNL